MNRERAWVTCTSSDPENNNFAISLEKLTLKKSDNGEVFEHVKNTFDLIDLIVLHKKIVSV